MSSNYSDEDIDAAVAAGVLSAQTADNLRSFAEIRRQASAADEEAFRFFTGFNDIFVTIAISVVLTGLVLVSAKIWGNLFSAVAVAIVSWALAEFFTRRRRLALPSILLLLAWVGSWLVAASLCLNSLNIALNIKTGPMFEAELAFVAIAAAYLHWLRFHVPITVALGTGTTVVALLGIIGQLPGGAHILTPTIAVAGLITLCFALWWDSTDPLRRTRRADVAFWLHIVAAPMIVHPIFATLTKSSEAMANATVPVNFLQPLVVVAIYIVLAAISLVIDRRALMVSGLIYLLIATSQILRATGFVSLSFAIAALMSGGALLLLSAFWRPLRKHLIRRIPASLKTGLPP